MKYHTIKSERYNLRCNGAYASYPVYTHNGERIGTLEAYSRDINALLEAASNGQYVGMFPYHETQTA